MRDLGRPTAGLSLSVLSSNERLSQAIPREELIQGLEKARTSRIDVIKAAQRMLSEDIEKEARILRSPSFQGTLFDVLYFDGDEDSDDSEDSDDTDEGDG